jgi:hypothetical protein
MKTFRVARTTVETFLVRATDARTAEIMPRHGKRSLLSDSYTEETEVEALPEPASITTRNAGVTYE